MQMLFIDSTLAEYQLLANGAVNTPVVAITPQQDSIEQIIQQVEVAYGQTAQPLTLHIVAHGAPGCVYLSNTELSLSTFNQYADRLKTLQGKVWQINFYSCNVAAGDAGAEFIDTLHRLTGADIAASTTKIGNAALGGNWDLDVTTTQAVTKLPIRAEALAAYSGVLELSPSFLNTNNLSIDEIQKYLIVGFTKQGAGGDAVELSNGELGRDGTVLSQGGSSATGASFPTLDSVFDQRYEDSGNNPNNFLEHPIDGTQISPFEGVDYSGHVAVTSSQGQISVSDTDIYGDLGGSLDDIAIVTANSSDPVQSISNADYFNDAAPPGSPTGQLPENSAGTNGAGFATGVNLMPLTDELDAWQSYIEMATAEGTLTQNIESENYKDDDGPYVIELLAPGGVVDQGSDLAFTDTNGDGVVIIDVDRGNNDWEINNSDVIIDGPDGITAIFRLQNGSNMNMSNSSIQIGEGGIANDANPFGAIFYVGDDEGNSGDTVFSGSNVVFNGVAFWELAGGSDDDGENVINIQDGQGCAQFIGDRVIHSNTRFTLCAVECFLTGTHILTANGEVAVEDLKIGDMVQTADGTLEPIKWIGRQTTTAERLENPLRGLPILIKAGALGNNLPKRDLYVSPDHAILFEGLLINAGAMVNDVSIIQTKPTEAFTYYHIELDKHALLISEGAASESYLPQKEDRYLYDNGAEYEELYPNQCNMILWPLDYPRVSSYTTVPRYVRKTLMAIANQLNNAKALQVV